MNKLLLNLALLPSGLWKSMGADTDQLRAILDVKLKLDDRKPVNFGRQKAQKKNRRFSIALGMFFSFITGVIYIMPLVAIKDTMLALTSFYSLFLFLLTFTLITDFSTVLIDTRDKSIVLPTPVSDRTLFLSRMLHVFIYLFRIVLPMSLPAWITIGLMYGWKAAIFFPLPLMLVMFTAMFLVMGCYLLILKLASPARFKDILGYFQIFVSIIVFASFYIGPRSMDVEQLRTFSINNFQWAKAVPSYWIATTWSWLFAVLRDGHTLYYSLLAILFPFIFLWITIKFFAPQFAARLGGLDAADSPAPSSKAKAVKGKKWQQQLSQLINRREEAQAGFIITWLQTARSRAFKMKIYPMFAYVPIYFIYLMLQGQRPLREVYETLPGTSKHLILLYMCTTVMMQAISMATISEQYKAAWVYYALPLNEPGAIMSGMFKAMWVKYFLPFFAAVSVFVLAVWGIRAIPDILLAMINVTLFNACIARIAVRSFPFSKIDQMDASGSKAIKFFATLLIPATLGFGHYAAMHFWWLKVLFMVLSSIFLWLVWDSYSHTQWSDMKKVED